MTIIGAAILDKIIKFLINYKYRHYPFYTWSWGIDENTDINILSAEYYPDRYRYGLREERYNQ